MDFTVVLTQEFDAKINRSSSHRDQPKTANPEIQWLKHWHHVSTETTLFGRCYSFNSGLIT